MTVITVGYKITTGSAAAQKSECKKRLGFNEPKPLFYKKILVQFNQLIPCSYSDI